MLVATPAAVSLADRKPRVISEIRKPHVQRSPSLDDLPRLSGTLNYYCNILGIWSQRTVSVRDGCLLVYGEECGGRHQPPARGYASLGRRAPLHHTRSATESLPYMARYSGSQTLGRTTTLRDASPDDLTFPGMSCGPGHTPLHHTCSDSTPSINYLPAEGPYSGVQSLGRARGAALAGLEFRLPLRHLNLMPNTLAPRAFSLSYRQHGNESAPVAVFQALNDLEYERWVKTLAVEIMRQTPLDAIRFLDVLGIAAISTPSSKSSPAFTPRTVSTKLTRLSENKQNSLKTRSTTQSSAPRWDRSPSSEGSTTSADFLHDKKIINSENMLRVKKITSVGQSLPRRKLCMSDVESQSDRDEVDSVVSKTFTKHKTPDNKCIVSGRKSREKLRRTRDIAENESSSEETRTIDEGIVLEERESSSERYCRRSLWPSDRSDCLDSPHSVSSYSSYELCDSPDAVDSVEEPSTTCIKKMEVLGNETKCTTEPVTERIYSKNVNSTPYHSNFMKKKCDKKVALEKILPIIGAKILLEDTVKKVPTETKIAPQVKKNTQLQMPLYRAQPYNVECASVSKSEHNDQPLTSTQMSSSKNTETMSQLTPSIVIHKIQSKDTSDIKNQLWSRARSCSPSNSSSMSPSYEGRGARALSVGQPLEPSVAILRMHCQDTEKYVPVKDKLALFESLCRVGRLARSSEELAAEAEKAWAPRARSLHDLTRERSPHVPVREICKFFEKFGSSEVSLETKQTKPSPVKVSERRFSENLPVKIAPHRQMPLREKHKSTDMYNMLSTPYINMPVVNCDQINLNVANNLNTKLKMDTSKCKNDVKNISSNYSNNSYQVNESAELSSKEAFDYGGFKQIRLGNKIITYV